MANVLAFFGILSVFAICYPALLLLIWHTQPAAARARERLERMPRRSAVLGLLISGLLALPVLGLVGSASGAAQLVGWLLLLAVLAVSAVGASGLAALLGGRIRPASHSPVLIGALALALATFFPVLGWLFALPVALFATLGASVLALFTRARRSTPPVPAIVPAPAQ
jgi:hypothetical protein